MYVHTVYYYLPRSQNIYLCFHHKGAVSTILHMYHLSSHAKGTQTCFLLDRETKKKQCLWSSVVDLANLAQWRDNNIKQFNL